MSASEQMRIILDQLMGTTRNGDGGSKAAVKFNDPRVCKSFLLQCCPHEILTSTRMDLGDCPKVHEYALRADYENASKDRDYFYDFDALEHLKEFIADCDRRTELAKRRLHETQEELSAEVAAKANSVGELAEQIGKLLAKAEALGAEGHVDKSLEVMEEVEEIRKKKSIAENDYRNSMPASSYQQQKLRVCEVCSAYLGIHDNDRRLADHFGGKLHLGFIKIRDKLAYLEKTVEERRAKRREQMELREKEEEEMKKERDKERERRQRDRSRERSRHRSRDRYRSRDRSRSREYKRRSRERDSRRHKEDRRDRDYDRRERDRYRRRSRDDKERSEDSRERRHRRRYSETSEDEEYKRKPSHIDEREPSNNENGEPTEEMGEENPVTE